MSSAKRLAALEVVAQREKQRRIDVNERIFGAALDLLPDGAGSVLLAGDEVRINDPERWEHLAALTQAICTGPLPDPVALPAGEWARVTVWSMAAEDALMAQPPRGAAAYFTAEAREWERALSEAVDPSEDFDTVARWHAAVFHFNAAMARVLGEQ